ncbi:endo-1,4-beta-glucanase [Coniosporium tulheliwenetii]|uniref:Endo-1,4-beta-glucanase n=1 Tax=Coniosporium tulheliwenetii TaxID=3383036 RepID=A0ACC2ZHR4_9PEZI|nr:endo-1,4-beta-glucanase [Cladosporium sp. JES 115]
MAPLRLRVDGATFRDPHNREVTLHGINVAADAKFPSRPDRPSHVAEDFFDGDNVSFAQRPFPVEEASTHFTRLRKWGYNTIRYVFTWEAIEAAGPRKYDEEWIQHTLSILRIARDHGFYIFMDPHQDVWSRFTGGSGAPMWTVYACGLNPRAFDVTEASLVQNTYPEPEKFPKMIWATNYHRLACQVIFTLFFGGKDFAPKAIIDGKNIQDWLQDHFFDALKHLAKRIHEAGDLENDVVIGWESLNEPNRGLIGHPDLSVIPHEQKLKKGQSAWLPADYDDTYYGWKRDPGWKLGECLWAQHGIWDPATDELLKKDYFAKDPRTGETIDYKYFTDHYWLEYYRRHSAMVKSVFPESIMFCQPPVLEVPPSMKGTKDDDPNIVFAPHFYDGVTLMTKKWNRLWNVDVFGLLRGRYLSPAFAIKIGETAIRNCFRDELAAIRKEGIDYMGNHPCVFTEIGIPYDMDDQYAYKTGDYSSQIAAMDANHFALEGCKANGFTLWTYVATNNHYWGDQWNGEDLSIYSKDDLPLPTPGSGAESRNSLDPNSPSYSQSQLSRISSITPSNLKQALSGENMTSTGSKPPSDKPDKPGYRAAEAFVRPTPIATHGDLLTHGFDLRNCIFRLSLTAKTPTQDDAPTEIFLPEHHFPQGRNTIEVSGGKWTISVEEGEGCETQRLRWWHGEGDQHITIKGVRRKTGTVLGAEEEEGIWSSVSREGTVW